MADYNINYLKREKNPGRGIMKSDGMNFFSDVDPWCSCTSQKWLFSLSSSEDHLLILYFSL